MPTVVGPDRSPFRDGFCTVSMFIGGAWVDADLEELSEDGVEIVRDATGGGSTSSGSCKFRLKDPSGKWSPRHPSSPYYGQIGKGTPVKVVTDLLGGAPSTRFYGEIVTFQPGWGRDGSRNAYVDVTGAGTLRRIGQGSSALRSPIYRGRSTIGAGLVAYWPAEDASGATRIAASSSKVKTGRILGSPSLASSTVVLGSDPLPTIEDGRFTFAPPSYSSTQSQVRVLFSLPAAGVTNGTEILRVGLTGGTLSRVSVTWQTGGSLLVEVFDSGGTSVSVASWATFLPATNKPYQLSIELNTSGSDVDVTTAILLAGATGGTFGTQTVTSQTLGRVVAIDVNPLRATMTGSTFGHVTLEKVITSIFDLDDQLTGYAGESATARLARLCGEAGISFTTYDATVGAPMGPQRSATIDELIRECEAADGGVLYEPRAAVDLGYRTRASLLSQTDVTTFPYVDNALLPFVPVEDDSATVNVSTITRAGGSSATVERTDGPLGSDPTTGVGRYEDSATLNVATDEQAELEAAWRVHLGTWDEARFPAIGFDFADPRILDDVLLVAALHTQIGLASEIDVTRVAEKLPWLPPFDVKVQVRGYTEKITPLSYRMDFVTVPARPYRVAVYGAATSRYSGDGTVTAAGFTSTATSFTVTPPAGVQWTHADGDFEALVAGEVMLVTNVTGTTTQTFTVLRSRNGVVKAHLAGEAVDLFDVVHYAPLP